MLRRAIATKRDLKLLELWATPRGWLLVASILWCAVLGCGLAYVILIASL